MVAMTPINDVAAVASPVRPRDAAVLLLLYPDATGQPLIPFIRRSLDLRRHQGQIGLPGGARDPDDASLLDTARREAWEELRIEPAAYEVVCHLDPVFTQVSNFHVYPFVGVAAVRPAFEPDAYEVAELLEVPLALLADPGRWREEVWELSTGRRLVQYCDFNGHRIWGLTARILSQFLAAGVQEHVRGAFERRVRDG